MQTHAAARRLQAVVLAGVIGLAGVPGRADARQAQPRTIAGLRTRSLVTSVQTAAIVGSAWNADNSPIPRARLRLRNVVSGQIQATTVADESGQFTFLDSPTGTYVVELVSDNGRILTIGHPLIVSPGETVATFVRLGSKVPWFTGFFGNAALAVATAAAATGLTALAPENMDPISGRQ